MRSTLISAVLIAAMFCWSGCAFLTVIYDSRRNVVANIFPRTPCEGSVEVMRDHGMVHFGVDGTWWDQNFYGVYFKNGVTHPTEFYLTLSTRESQPRIVQSKGTVQLQPDDYVLIDVQYLDSDGTWVSPPINGRHRIDVVLPEGRRH